MSLVSISRKLSLEVNALSFQEPVSLVYNPLDYAKRSSEEYLKRYGADKKEVLLVGMNPGPFGMVQTGVPFGEISMVRDWMGIEKEVDSPPREHPKRPILGFSCQRSEVSGRRLWGWAKERYVRPEKFFSRFFVWNYCPLAFLEEGGKNRTPDKLPKHECEALYDICDMALAKIVDELDPEYVIGVGKFAEKRINLAIPNSSRKIGSILHPSPASPKANRGWMALAEQDFEGLGIQL